MRNLIGWRTGASRQLSIVAAVAMCALLLAACTSRSHADQPTPSARVSPSPSPQPSMSSGWLSYHANDSRTAAVDGGDIGATPGITWTALLGGAVYGQPLIDGNFIYAATETNRVVALNAADGSIVWSTSVGLPLKNVRSVAGCGDIDPLGITSTPVIDPTSNTIYVVAEISDGGGRVHHQLLGLDLTTGAVERSIAVDPPLAAGQKSVWLLQRASLAIANGRVYVGYGGNDGDCGNYHGWVVGVEEKGAADPVTFEVASDGQGGAIWESGGAPAVDSAGNLYVTTGNANPDPPAGGPDPKMYTESVVKLSPDLTPLASFKDRVAGGDEDLATGNPVLLPGGLVFATGKTDIGFLLNRSDLSLVAEIHGECGSNPDGGAAFDAATSTLFVPCKNGGIQEINVADRKLGPRLSGANGAPILVGPDLWAAEYPAGTLTEFDAASGRALFSTSLHQTVPHFASPSSAAGSIYIGTTAGVVALSGK